MASDESVATGNEPSLDCTSQSDIIAGLDGLNEMTGIVLIEDLDVSG